MSKKLGERLIDAGLISAAALEKGLAQQRITGHKLGDSLVEIGLLQEAALLRFLAQEFKTRFVSTEKLAAAKIPTDTLDRIPVRMAEQQMVIPLAWDKETLQLSVVMAEPQNEALVREIQLVTEAEEVHAYLALRSAINAGIRKHYYGDTTAFQTAAESGGGPQGRSDLSGIQRAYESQGTGLRSPPALRIETDARGRPRGSTGVQPTQMRELLVARGHLGESDYAETLSILVGMLEARREHFAGHSALLARHAALVARRLGLPPREVSHVTIAALLHDLAKPQERHFTLASLQAQRDWKAEARAHVRAPIKLFESVHLPVTVNAILAQLHEAFDGSGIPQGAKGEDIAAGARVIAAVDAYLDLTRNPDNGLGRALGKAEALAHLQAEAGKLYDPEVVGILEKLQSGDVLRQRLENDGRAILVAEPDPAVRGALVGRLLKAGMLAHGVASLEGLPEALARGEVDLLVLGIRLGLQEVLALTQFVRSQPECGGVPVAVLGEPDPQTREQLRAWSVNTVIPLPLDAEAAAQAVMDLNEDRIAHGAPARRVQGTFDELSMVEVLSVLARHRKSGRLTVQQGPVEAQIHVESGKAVFARATPGRTPDEALVEVATRARGEFAFDGNAVLMELPNLDTDLEFLVKRLKPAQPRAT
jgi:HD-GYP domain-containing protein (c-di-GMP phosphodiesterase class II)